jgi:hypothetical protein
MIPGDAQVGVRSQKLDTGIGIGTIAYNVSQAPDLIYRSRVIQHGLKGLQVGVYIRKYQVTHAQSFAKKVTTMIPYNVS